MAMTIATIGRLMKKLDIGFDSFGFDRAQRTFSLCAQLMAFPPISLPLLYSRGSVKPKQFRTATVRERQRTPNEMTETFC
jgi:hypothetical protein